MNISEMKKLKKGDICKVIATTTCYKGMSGIVHAFGEEGAMASRQCSRAKADRVFLAINVPTTSRGIITRMKMCFPEEIERGGKMNNYIEFVRYDAKRGIVRVNPEWYFVGISKKVWEYTENGYQVVMKYLVDRKKKDLTQQEIDEFFELARRVKVDVAGR